MDNSSLKYFFMITYPRISLTIFITLVAIGMYLYPGSTYHDHETMRYLFNENFLSDLGRTITHGGSNNFHSSILFNTSLMLGAVTYIIFYLLIKELFDSNLISKLGSLFGVLGSLCMIGVALTPSDLFLSPHILFNMWLFRFFLLSTLCYTWLIYKNKQINNSYLAGNLIFIVFLLIYIIILMYGPSPRESHAALILQALSQKIILFNFMLSIIVQTMAYNKILRPES